MAALHADHVLACDFISWHPRFQHLTYRSLHVDVTPDFLNYLLQDGVFAAAGSAALPRRARGAKEEDWSDAEEMPQEEPGQAHCFTELYDKINAAIESLGGKVVPKLNWSCPSDATWINPTQSLACTNADEVVMLLKSSDRIVHDICQAFQDCAGQPSRQHVLTLILQRWAPLRPEGELRCFVHKRELVAVSQRNLQQPFPELQQQSQEIVEKLQDVLEDHVTPRFPLKDYTVDVYITSKGAVKVMGFNPIGGTTLPLLFSWDELPYPHVKPPPLGQASPFLFAASAGRTDSSGMSAATEEDLQAELLSSGWHMSTPSSSNNGSTATSRQNSNSLSRQSSGGPASRQGSIGSASSGYASPAAAISTLPAERASSGGLLRGLGLPPKHRPPMASRPLSAAIQTVPLHNLHIDQDICSSLDSSLFSPSDSSASSGPPSEASDQAPMEDVHASPATVPKPSRLAWQRGGVDFRCLQDASQLTPNLPKQATSGGLRQL